MILIFPPLATASDDLCATGKGSERQWLYKSVGAQETSTPDHARLGEILA